MKIVLKHLHMILIVRLKIPGKSHLRMLMLIHMAHMDRMGHMVHMVHMVLGNMVHMVLVHMVLGNMVHMVLVHMRRQRTQLVHLVCMVWWLLYMAL